MSDRLYRIGAVAEMSGLTIDVLRAWERRYAILRPDRTEGGFRLYSERDVDVLKEVRRLVAQGMSIGEIAPLVPEIRKRVDAGALAGTAAPRIEDWRARVMAAVERLDPEAIEAVFDEALASLPALRVLDELLIPLEREIGDRWHAGKATVAQEHLLSTVVRSRLLVLVHGAPRGSGEKALLACFPDEQHDVGAWAAALRLRYAGWRIAVLGARTPTHELAEAVRTYQPKLIGLSAIADPGEGAIGEVLSAIRDVLPKGTTVLIGGAGAEHRASEIREGGAQLARLGWESALPGPSPRGSRRSRAHS